MAISIKSKGQQKISGGELVARMLAAEGVEKAFGIIDGTYFPLQAALKPNGIALLTPRHETCAAHMAGAYARLTGKLGVCMASNGPGVANILPGVAVENAEGNRVLLLTSCRRPAIAYPDRGGAYQYFPHADVTRPMTKWSAHVPSIDRLAEMLRRAFRISWQGRPGVVHLDIPENLFHATFDLSPGWLREPGQYRTLEPISPPRAQVEAAARMLREARHPVIHAGSGVVHAGAEAELRAVAELLEAPITTSWGARCALDERTDHALSMIYVDAVNEARVGADLVLALGSRLGETDWWGKPPYWGVPGEQRFIQVDIDPQHLGDIRPADLPVLADIKVFLTELLAVLRQGPVSSHLGGRRSRLAKIVKAKAARRKALDKHLADHGIPMHSAHVATVCRRVFDDDAVLVIDGGNTSIWANFYHEVRRPHSVLGTPKMGMLGAGVSQALGAQAARPDAQVCVIIGDGAMGFHVQEIETAVRHGLPVVYLVLCDRQWGMVKMTQQFFVAPIKTLAFKSLDPKELVNTELGEVAFDEVARAMGAHGERVADPAGLEGAIRRSLASGRCSVIHVDVDPVKHTWAPHLKTFKDMHQEPSGKPR